MARPARASVDPIQIEPPDIEQLDSRDFTLSYDEEADTLFIYFISGDIRPVSVLIDPDKCVYALVEPVSWEVVGVQLEDFLARLVYERPEFLALDIWAGISPDRLDQVTLEISEQITRHGRYRDARRRVFDLSVKEQIEQFFHALGDGGVAAIN